ncbi:MAG: amidohydrolase family protein, partial [Gammaproteobacteria bacterium]|nr:amidohydrolase family protein [Gammaproteobacteria bacterium]
MIVDSHQHFWSLGRGDYGWLTPDLQPIYRDFLPSDLVPHLDSLGIRKTVLVQAAPTVAETEFLLQIAASTDFVGGVVGWVDLESHDAADTIESLAKDQNLLGIRPMVQDLADEHWLARSSIEPGIAVLEENQLRFDALVTPKNLPSLCKFLARHKDLPVVIDHGAKPNIAAGEFGGWAESMAWIGAETKSFCKLSGLLTEAGESAEESDLLPYVSHLFEHFGAERLMWGSDWPVLEMVGVYEQWFDMAQSIVEELNPGAQRQVFGETAVAFYGL